MPFVGVLLSVQQCYAWSFAAHQRRVKVKTLKCAIVVIFSLRVSPCTVK